MNHFGVKAGIVLAIAMLLCSCSEKHPVGPGGQPELFFNWLPALLADQSSAQPCHELMEYLDNAINLWLDGHPEVEVKFVTSTIGQVDGKNERAIVTSVWY